MSETAITANSPQPNLPAKDGWTWPQETRDLALELYMLKAGRYLPTVGRLLYEDYGIEVPARTLRYWSVTDQWDVTADERLAAVAPNINARIAGDVMVAAMHGAQYLLRVNAGEASPNRESTMSAQAALNAAGFGSYSRRDTSSRRALPADTEDSASSPEDAARRIAERRARFGSKV